MIPTCEICKKNYIKYKYKAVLKTGLCKRCLLAYTTGYKEGLKKMIDKEFAKRLLNYSWFNETVTAAMMRIWELDGLMDGDGKLIHEMDDYYPDFDQDEKDQLKLFDKV